MWGGAVLKLRPLKGGSGLVAQWVLVSLSLGERPQVAGAWTSEVGMLLVDGGDCKNDPVRLVPRELKECKLNSAAATQGRTACRCSVKKRRQGDGQGTESRQQADRKYTEGQSPCFLLQL